MLLNSYKHQFLGEQKKIAMNDSTIPSFNVRIYYWYYFQSIIFTQSEAGTTRLLVVP
jgi:hypothetical protein